MIDSAFHFEDRKRDRSEPVHFRLWAVCSKLTVPSVPNTMGFGDRAHLEIFLLSIVTISSEVIRGNGGSTCFYPSAAK